MKKLIWFSYIIITCLSISAQDIEVKKFEPLEKDQTAVTSPRKDINGNTCGLVKVVLKENGLQFEGNIIGDVETTGTEYFVYLSGGTKRINIKHPNYLPITVAFSDFGVNKIVPGKVYRLELKAEKRKMVNSDKKGTIILKIIPSNAELFVDGNLITKESGGLYDLSLPIGAHFCAVKYSDFVINKLIKVNKKVSQEEINLTEYFTFLSINCETKDVVLYVNNELKGIDKWEGTLPPGKLKIEAKREGFQTMTKTIEAKESDSITVNLPSLELLKGKIEVNTTPIECKVFLDSTNVGRSPLNLDNIPIGKHVIRVENELCRPYSETFVLEEGQNRNFTINLEFKDKMSELISKAQGGDKKAQYDLGMCYAYISSNISGWNKNMIDHKKAFFWFKKSAEQGFAKAQNQLAWCYNNGKGVKCDGEQAFYWAKKAAEQNSAYGCYLVGTGFVYGWGVKKDIKQGIYWLKKAIILDDYTDAKELLKKLGYESEIPSSITF